MYGGHRRVKEEHVKDGAALLELVQANWKADMFHQGKIFQDATADINV